MFQFESFPPGHFPNGDTVDYQVHKINDKVKTPQHIVTEIS